MFDGDSDGVLDSEDVRKFFDKIAELALALLDLFAATIRVLAAAVAVPLVNIAFAAKSQFVGGLSDEFTSDELELALATFLPVAAPEP